MFVRQGILHFPPFPPATTCGNPRKTLAFFWGAWGYFPNRFFGPRLCIVRCPLSQGSNDLLLPHHGTHLHFSFFSGRFSSFPAIEFQAHHFPGATICPGSLLCAPPPHLLLKCCATPQLGNSCLRSFLIRTVPNLQATSGEGLWGQL